MSNCYYVWHFIDKIYLHMNRSYLLQRKNINKYNYWFRYGIMGHSIIN